MPSESKVPDNKILTSISQAYFLTFISVNVYIFITIISITDDMFMLKNMVSLPLFNIQISTIDIGFFAITPLIILSLHFFLLMNAYVIKLGSFLQRNDELQFWGFSIIIWLVLVFIPLFVLLSIQARYLSYHDWAITLFHQIVITFDVIALIILWPSIYLYDNQKKFPYFWCFFNTIAAITLSISYFIMTIPDADELKQDDWLYKLKTLNLREKMLVAEKLDANVISALRDGSPQEQDEAMEKVSPLTYLQGHDLRYANLFNAVLPKLDLRAARLNSLKDPCSEAKDPCLEACVAKTKIKFQDGGVVRYQPTQLQHSDLSWALMPGVLLDDANLKDAKLQHAWLQKASLQNACLQMADLSGAKLQGANLQGADLKNAILSGALLQGADLRNANLQSAKLNNTQLQGASLRDTKLQYANLKDANLQGTDISYSNLGYAIFSEDNADNSNDKSKGATLYHALITCYAPFMGAELIINEMYLLFETQPIIDMVIHNDIKRLQKCLPHGKFEDEQKLKQNQWFLYSSQIINHLVKMACSDDDYIVKGLILQITDSGSGRQNVKALAQALYEQATLIVPCHGLKDLSKGNMTALENFLKNSNSSK